MDENHALTDLVKNRKLILKGERIRTVYHIRAGEEAEAKARALDICYEQTVELPPSVIPVDSDVGRFIVGRIESLEAVKDQNGLYSVRISYAAESAGNELTQLINLLFGNISLKPGVRLMDVELPLSLIRQLPGPRYGIDGLRMMLGVHGRPLLCTALKPMGLSANDHAKLAYDFAMGGMDIIKDDHGVTSQSFAPFRERVKACSEAVAEANAKTGRRSIYMPSLTSPAHLLEEKAHYAKEVGAGGLLVTPGITGFDSMRMIAEKEDIALPLMAHPSFLGSFTTSPDSGIHHSLIYSLLPRLAGADAVVFPNTGGRFSFTPEEVKSIAHGARRDLFQIRRSFPVPAGGMTLDRVSEMLQFYGKDTVLLMGGGLYSAGPDLQDTTKRFLNAVGG